MLNLPYDLYRCNEPPYINVHYRVVRFFFLPRVFVLYLNGQKIVFVHKTYHIFAESGGTLAIRKFSKSDQDKTSLHHLILRKDANVVSK